MLSGHNEAYRGWARTSTAICRLRPRAGPELIRPRIGAVNEREITQIDRILVLADTALEP